MEETLKQILSELKELKTDVSGLKGDISGLKGDVSALKNQVGENTLILRALEHAAEVNKADHDNMTHQLAEISGDINSMRKDISNVELITASNWSDIVKLKAIK